MKLTKFLFLLLLTACAPQLNTPVTKIVNIYITATPKPTQTPTGTPSPFPTPTTSPTPTATSIPVIVSGSPRSYQLLDPTPVYGAPCGLVDTFDFPLDPPDGDNARGGFGFGNFNTNHNKFHAGEDWGFNRLSNLGQSVYSIGHGQVTYSAPSGWGLDGGTIVIRHVFPWGGYVLSFYGHISPSSVTLRAGDCVQRGDEVGKIGKPRTPPHLHFEVRLHLPNSTGHGYWSSDPGKAGWLPPSQTILETRMAASPGILWTRSYAEGLTKALGISDQDLIIIQNDHINAVDPTSGILHWTHPISDTFRNAHLDAKSEQLYLLDLGGDLTAYATSNPSQSIWKAELNALSSAVLIPFPEGGLLIADRHRARLVTPDGQLQWQISDFANPTSWVGYHNTVILTTKDPETPLWIADSNNITAWENGLGGILAQSEEWVYILTENGLFQLDIMAQAYNNLYDLGEANPFQGGLTVLSNGDALILVQDRFDRRLLYINQSGSLNWERSVRNLPRGEVQLFTQDNQSYLFLSHTSTAGIQAELYKIDLENKALTHIMTGGSRQSYSRDTWLLPLNVNNFIVNFGGGPIAAFNPEEALKKMTSP